MQRQTRITYKRLYVVSLCLYLLCLPLGAVNIGTLGSAAKLLAILPIGLALVGGRIAKMQKTILLQLLFTLVAALSIVWSVSTEESFSRVFSYIMLFLLLFSGCMFDYSDRDIQKIKLSLVWSSRITAILVLLFGSYIEKRLYMEGIIQEDPNYLCAYFAFGVIAALQQILSREKFFGKIWPIVELAIYLYVVVLTGSRGGLIAIMAGILMYFLYTGNRSAKGIVLKISAMVVVLLLLSVAMNYIPEELRIRFTVEDVVSGGGSGRITIWKNAWDLYINSPLWRKLVGYGTATIITCFDKYGYSRLQVAHNIFLETLVELGFAGFCIYSMTILAFVKATRKNVDKFSYAVLVCMIVLSLSVSLYTFKPYFHIMLYILICHRIKIPPIGRKGEQDNV